VTAIAAATALSLAVAGCTAPAGEDEPTALRVGWPSWGLAGSYDPTGINLSTPSALAVYEGLFAWDSAIEYGGFQPNLATGYERSEDWKTVTLTLRDDVTFVDGEKFTAEGLKTYLEGMSQVEGWWFKATWDLNSPTFEAVDETTLVITSEKPMKLGFAGFLHVLFTVVVIASPNALDDLAASAENPLGSGPYVLESSTPEVSATFVRNEDYWNTQAFPFDTVEYLVFDDEVAGLNALTTGQIDATGISIPLAKEAESKGLTLSVYPDEPGGGGPALIVLDRAGVLNPALADKRVRQAMALAFDREAIRDSLNQGYGSTSGQPFLPGTPEYVDDGDDRYEYDPERAKELLAEAGYPDGFDLSILAGTTRGYTEYGPLVIQYLGDIGIRVTFDAFEDGDFFTKAISGTDHPVLLYSSGAVDTFYVFVSPDAVFNPFKTPDATVEDLWSKINTGPDDAANDAADKLGEYVVDQSNVIVFSNPPQIWATAPGFTTENFSGTPSLARFGLAD
jgi:peptide/nickel transport system substrate-binding protein